MLDELVDLITQEHRAQIALLVSRNQSIIDGWTRKARKLKWADHPGHDLHDKIVAAYVPKLIAAFTDNVTGIDAAIRSMQQVTTVKGISIELVKDSGVDPSETLNAVRQNVKISTTQATAALQAIYGEAYLAGSYVAAQTIGHGAAVLQGLEDAESSINWSSWTPGWAEAADLVSDGGLQSLLDSAGLTIQGITDSIFTRLGNALADGLASGAPVDNISDSMNSIIMDPDRAQVIATTETARAMSQATLNTYDQNGIDQWEWLTEDDPCPDCEDNADNGPYDVGDGGAPTVPEHPNCRCVVIPVVNVPDDEDADTGDEGE